MRMLEVSVDNPYDSKLQSFVLDETGLLLSVRQFQGFYPRMTKTQLSCRGAVKTSVINVINASEHSG